MDLTIRAAISTPGTEPMNIHIATLMSIALAVMLRIPAVGIIAQQPPAARGNA